MLPKHQRIGIFGGTFDPIHLGHLIAATDLRHALNLDRVLFVPAMRPPHKSSQIISADEHRLAMLRLAIEGEPAFAVDTIELDQAGASYTSDTIGLLGERLRPAVLWFLMGADSLRDLPTWHRPDQLARLAYLGVARRPGVQVDVESVLRQVPAARDRVSMIPTVEVGISASDLRRRVAAELPISYQVLPRVERYIRDHRLYRAPDDTPAGTE